MEALAHAAGVSLPTIQRAETNRHRTSDENRAAIAEALGLDEEDLFHDPDATEASNWWKQTEAPVAVSGKSSATRAR